MKLFLFACLSAACVIGLTMAQGFGYSPYGSSAAGSSQYLGYGLILFVLLFFIIFQNNKKTVPLYWNNQSLGVNVPVTGRR